MIQNLSHRSNARCYKQRANINKKSNGQLKIKIKYNSGKSGSNSSPHQNLIQTNKQIRSKQTNLYQNMIGSI